MDVAVPEQMVCAGGAAVTFGVGLTVTVIVTGVPEQPLTVGVAVYTAVPAVEPVAVNVCEIEVPLLAEAPETPVCVTVQAYVVPETLLFSVMEVEVPEQIVCVAGVAVSTGTGFTVMVTVTGDPVQPFAVGVIE